MRRGTVAAFDDHRGWGVIRANDDREFPFHCTRLTDGTRAIAAGTAVTFEVVAGHLGRWEATDVTKS